MAKIILSTTAEDQFEALKAAKSKTGIFKAVRKTLGMMETDLRHPSPCTHEFTSMQGPNGEKVFEAYAQNRTPGAYRVFWYYGPKRGQLTVLAITPHP